MRPWLGKRGMPDCLYKVVIGHACYLPWCRRSVPLLILHHHAIGACGRIPTRYSFQWWLCLVVVLGVSDVELGAQLVVWQMGGGLDGARMGWAQAELYSWAPIPSVHNELPLPVILTANDGASQLGLSSHLNQQLSTPCDKRAVSVSSDAPHSTHQCLPSVIHCWLRSE